MGRRSPGAAGVQHRGRQSQGKGSGPARARAPPGRAPAPMHTMVLPLPVMKTLLYPCPSVASRSFSASSAGSLRRGRVNGVASVREGEAACAPAARAACGAWRTATSTHASDHAPVERGLLQVVDGEVGRGAAAVAQPAQQRQRVGGGAAVEVEGLEDLGGRQAHLRGWRKREEKRQTSCVDTKGTQAGNWQARGAAQRWLRHAGRQAGRQAGGQAGRRKRAGASGPRSRQTY